MSVHIIQHIAPDVEIKVAARPKYLPPGVSINFGKEVVIILTDAQVDATVEHLNAYIRARMGADILRFPTRQPVSHTGPAPDGPGAA